MEIKVVHPLMLTCNNKGEITGIRILCLTIDAHDYCYINNADDAGDIIPFSRLRTLIIKKIVKKSVRNISMLDVRRDKKYRNVVWNFKQLCLLGASTIPVLRADGSMLNADVYAVIGDKFVTSTPREPIFFDYKGTAYTEEQLCSKYSDAANKIKQLKSYVYAPPKGIVQGLAFSNKLTLSWSYFSCDTKLLRAPLSDVEKREYVAYQLVLTAGTNVEVTPQGDYVWICDADNSLTSITAPSFCNIVIVHADKESMQTIVVSENVGRLEVDSTVLSRIMGMGEVQRLCLHAFTSEQPLPRPRLLSATPGGSTVAFYNIAIVEPYFEQVVDYSKDVYDVGYCCIQLGRQQSQHVYLPEAQNLRYSATLYTGVFRLTVNAAEFLRYMPNLSEWFSLSTAEITLAFDACKVRLAQIDMQASRYRRINLYLGGIGSKEEGIYTQVTLPKIKGIQLLRLSTDTTITEDIMGSSPIQEFEYQPTGGVYGPVSSTVVHAPVCLLVYYLEPDAPQKPLYLFGGVKTICFVCMKYSEDSFYGAAARNVHIHVPRGTKNNIHYSVYTQDDYEFEASNGDSRAFYCVKPYSPTQNRDITSVSCTRDITGLTRDTNRIKRLCDVIIIDDIDS